MKNNFFPKSDALRATSLENGVKGSSAKVSLGNAKAAPPKLFDDRCLNYNK